MTILFLTREYNHSKLKNNGGTGAFIKTLSAKLIERGVKVHVVGISNNNASFEDNGVKVVFYKSLFKRNFIFEFLRSISKKNTLLSKIHKRIHKLERKDIAKIVHKYIAKNNLKIDIIESHDFEGIYWCLKTDIPIVVRFHGNYNLFEKYFNYKNIELGRKYCEMEAVKKTNNFITVSNFSDKLNKEIFKLEHTKIIYNGIDTTYFKNKDIETIDYSVFYFGTISEEKGADKAFEIFVKIYQIDSRFTLHYVGRKTNFVNSLIHKATELNIIQKVFFYDSLKDDVLLSTLSKAELVLFPSKGETFGLALCEAMSMGKIVLCSNIEAYREIVTHNKNGYICNNIEEYVKIIDDYYNNKSKYLGIKNEARTTIENDFSINKMVDETIIYYKSILF